MLSTFLLGITLGAGLASYLLHRLPTKHTLPRLSKTLLASAIAVKSLLSFGQETGYLRFNVGKALRVPKGAPSSLSERIISEAEAHRMIDREPDARTHVVLLLL